MDKDEICDTAEEIIHEMEKIDKFESTYSVDAYSQKVSLSEKLGDFIQKIPVVEVPNNFDELLYFDLRQKFAISMFDMNRMLLGETPGFKSIIETYGIPMSDLNMLRPWLKKNKKSVMNAIDRLFEKSNIKQKRLGMVNTLGICERAEKYALTNAETYHKVIGDLIERRSDIGNYLRDISIDVTWDGRSFFLDEKKMLALSISAMCYLDSAGILRLDERELIRLYGHEGMGHGLIRVITNHSKLPHFLKTDFPSTISTEESITQFYEKVIFDDILNAPETQNELKLTQFFGGIYQDFRDNREINEFYRRLFFYAIKTVASPNYGKHPKDADTIKKKIECIDKVAIDHFWSASQVEALTDKFDNRGNVDVETVSELRYAVEVVDRVLWEFEKCGIGYEGKTRSLIDSVLLTGHWTPEALVHRARITAEQYKRQGL